MGAVGESPVDPSQKKGCVPPCPTLSHRPSHPPPLPGLPRGCSQPGIQRGNWLIVLREHSRGCNPTRSLARGQGLLGESGLAAECLPQPDAWVLTGAGPGSWAPVKPFFQTRPRMINEVEGQGTHPSCSRCPTSAFTQLDHAPDTPCLGTWAGSPQPGHHLLVSPQSPISPMPRSPPEPHFPPPLAPLEPCSLHAPAPQADSRAAEVAAASPFGTAELTGFI